MQKAKLLKDTTSYMGTTYLTQFLSFARGIVVARLLNPVLYGYFSGLGLILLYNPYAQLGVLQGMFREMSIKKGAGCTQELDDLKNNAFSFILLAATFVFFALFLYSVIYATKLGPQITWGLRAFAIICILNHQEMLYHDLLRLDHRFSEINSSRLIFSVSNIVLSIMLIIIWGFYGVLIAFICAMISSNAYLMLRGRYRFRIIVQKYTLWRFLRTGLPIALCFFTMILMNSIDRLMIIHFLAARELGFYGVALAFSMFIFHFSENISYVIQPRILEHYGKHNSDPKSLVDIYEKSTIILAVGMSIITGIFVLVIEPTIHHLLPRYVNTITVSQIIVFGIFFFSVNQIALRVVMALGNFMTLIIMQFAIVLLNIFLNYIAIYYGYGINGIAVATSISYFIYSCMIIQFLFRKFEMPINKGVIKNLKMYFPVTVAGVVPYIISKIHIFKYYVNKNIFFDCGLCLIKVLILLIFFIPFLVFLEKQTNIFELARKLFLKI